MVVHMHQLYDLTKNIDKPKTIKNVTAAINIEFRIIFMDFIFNLRSVVLTA